MKTQAGFARQGVILGIIGILVVAAIVWAMVVKNNKDNDRMMENKTDSQSQDNSMMDDNNGTPDNSMMDDSDKMSDDSDKMMNDNADASGDMMQK